MMAAKAEMRRKGKNRQERCRDVAGSQFQCLHAPIIANRPFLSSCDAKTEPSVGVQSISCIFGEIPSHLKLHVIRLSLALVFQETKGVWSKKISSQIPNETT
jgi:hypothetical protein